MPTLIIGLNDKVSVTETSQGVDLHAGYKTHSYYNALPGTVKALLRLAGGATAWEELIAGIEACCLANFLDHLDKISALGLVTWSAEENGNIIARLSTTSPGFSPRPTTVEPEQAYRLSRFAYSRRLKETTVVETPLKPVRLELSGWLSGAVWLLLSKPLNALELCAAIPGSDPCLVKLLLGLFSSAGVIQAVHGLNSPEEEDPVLKQWEFHDLLFHSRARPGRHDQPSGDTFLFWPKISPLPACKTPMPGEVIALEKPDLEQLLEEDYPLTLILEERRSILDYGPKAITLSQIGEFLYRSARVKSVRPINLEVGAAYESSRRPYPGVGGCYELEIYLTVGECSGLESGLYHYNPQAHNLTKLCPDNSLTGLILKQADMTADRSCKPQVVITVTARFSRVAWKYSSIAYSLILKDVGVLFQTMYLVATAMDLAPCALDSGHADLLCQAAGLDYLEESPVGDFLLGSKRTG